MKVKYSISSKYNPSLVEPIITLENDTCESVNEIISVIIDHLKGIDRFNKCFLSKQQYKLSFIQDKGYTVTPYGQTNPEESFSYSLRAFLNRSFVNLVFTENSIWRCNFWVQNAGGKLVVLDGSPRDRNAIMFTIKLTLKGDV